MSGVLWFITSDDERCLDFPEEFFRYVCEDRSMVVRFLEGCVVEKGLDWSYLRGEVAMEVPEKGWIGQVTGLVLGREKSASVAPNFLAGVSEGRFEGYRGDEEPVV